MPIGPDGKLTDTGAPSPGLHDCRIVFLFPARVIGNGVACIMNP